MSNEPMDGTEDLGDDAATAAVLAAFAPVLADEAVWAEPPAELADSFMAVIATERAAGPPAAPRAPMVAAQRRRTRRPRSTWWLAAAAAIVAIVAVGVVATSDDDGGGEQFALEGTELALGASAQATLTEPGAGTEVQLEIDDLPPAPDGFYYQAWARSPDGELVSMGTFHMRDGDATVTLWSGVDPADFPIVTVTIQQLGAGPESSGQVVMRGSIDG